MRAPEMYCQQNFSSQSSINCTHAFLTHLPHSICFLMTGFAITLSLVRLLASAFTANYEVLIVSIQIPTSKNLISLVHLFLCSVF